MPKYFLVCPQYPVDAVGTLEEFRIPEIESVAQVTGVQVSFKDCDITDQNPVLSIQLASDDDAIKLASRLTSVKHIWEYWGCGKTYEEVFESLKQNESAWKTYTSASTSFKFTPTSYGVHLQPSEKTEIIESFKWMEFEGKIDLKHPDVEIGVWEENALGGGSATESKGRKNGMEHVKKIWIGRKISETYRPNIANFSLKTRAYIGNTTMDPEVSLLMANQGLVRPGSLVWDPFAGTGSMLLTASAFGGLSWGSDIDGRQMRGKGTNIFDSAEQYGVKDKIVDLTVFDLNHHPFRTGELFDAIITDPPYGVRAGAKKLGRRPKNGVEYVPKPVPSHVVQSFDHTTSEEKPVYPHELPNFVPPTQPWPLPSVIYTLITTSAKMLKPSGRLVFFLPTTSEEYQESDIPNVPGMKIISNTNQEYGKWCRRLVTMEKVASFIEEQLEEVDMNVGHLHFREKYYAKVE